jgi:uncharacterized protein YqeY
MGLKEQLRNDLTEAMKAGDVERRNVLRMLLAAVKQEEVDEQVTLDDAGVQLVLARQVKQRREAIADARKAGRDEMVADEQAELAIIETYLPEMMSRDEIRAEAQRVIDETGVDDMRGMGQVMGRLMPRLKGRADGSVVSDVVRELLR